MYTLHCPDWCDPWPGDHYDTLEEAVSAARHDVRTQPEDSGRVTVCRIVPVCRVEIEFREVNVARIEEAA